MYDIERLRPVALDDLVRLGSRHDGGYVLPRRAIAATDILLSFGINDDWNFEKQFLRAYKSLCSAKRKSCLLFAFDASVSGRILRQEAIRLARQSLSAFFRLDFAAARRWGIVRMKSSIEFDLFFNQRKRKFFPFFLGKKTEGKFVDFNHIFNKIIGMEKLSEQSIFLKMDIEGAEYESLPLLTPYLSKINAMVFEFHDLDRCGEMFESIVASFSGSFFIAHIHANNFGGYIENSKLPLTLEICFLNKELLNHSAKPSTLSYPVPDLDSPCDPDIPDLPIHFGRDDLQAAPGASEAQPLTGAL
jgi:hypothetical protein